MLLVAKQVLHPFYARYNKVYRVVVEYENGDVDKELALKRLKTETLCDQILFHTDESLKYLKFCGVEEN